MTECIMNCANIGPRAAARAYPLATRVVFVAILICLSGCAHYFYLTADDFNRGRASDIQFQRDNASCQTAATVRQNEVGGGGDPHGVYNRAYAACMARRGYATNNIDLLDIGA